MLLASVWGRNALRRAETSTAANLRLLEMTVQAAAGSLAAAIKPPESSALVHDRRGHQRGSHLSVRTGYVRDSSGYF
jgi:heme A synthase